VTLRDRTTFNVPSRQTANLITLPAAKVQCCQTLVTYPITVTLQSQISQKHIQYTNISPTALLAVVKGSKSKQAKELANRLIPILEDLAK